MPMAQAFLFVFERCTNIDSWPGTDVATHEGCPWWLYSVIMECIEMLQERCL
jgi:hypothetical protein